MFADTGPGAAAELAYHSLTGHDVTGALAASARAGEEAERIGAPAEARRHYDQALELGDRVADAARLAGTNRERTVLASRMLEAADAAGSAWLEMWGRLWRIDTLFETGQLRSVRRELADLEGCVERLPGLLAEWHFLLTSATLALSTGRFTEATRAARRACTSGSADPV